MISSGWRKTRKVYKNQYIVIYNDSKQSKEEWLLSPIEDLFTSYTPLEDMNDAIQYSNPVMIKIREATNYDFYDCHIYIDGNYCKQFKEESIDCIRNCTFNHCLIMSYFEDNLYFRYCEFFNTRMKLAVEILDLSQCTIDGLHLKEFTPDIKIIGDELSFNSHYDDRCLLNIKDMTVKGNVEWVWFYHHTYIAVKKLLFNQPKCLDLAVNDDHFLPKILKNLNLIVVSDDYTIHDYAEEREERGFPSYFIN